MSSPKSPQSTATPTPTSPLLRLPPEISTQIYTLVLPSKPTIHLQPPCTNPRCQTYSIHPPNHTHPALPSGLSWASPNPFEGPNRLDRSPLPLLLTCRQIHAVVARLVYTRHTFSLTSSAGSEAGSSAPVFAAGFLTTIGPVNRGLITRLTLSNISPPQVTWGSTLPSLPLRFAEPDDTAAGSAFEGAWERVLGVLIPQMGMLRVLNLYFRLEQAMGWDGRVGETKWMEGLVVVAGRTGAVVTLGVRAGRSPSGAEARRGVLGRVAGVMRGVRREQRGKWGVGFGVKCVEFGGFGSGEQGEVEVEGEWGEVGFPVLKRQVWSELFERTKGARGEVGRCSGMV